MLRLELESVLITPGVGKGGALREGGRWGHQGARRLTHSSVRMLMGYRTGMLVVAELSFRRPESSLSLHWGHREGSIKEGLGQEWGAVCEQGRGAGGMEGWLTSSRWRAASQGPPRSCPAVCET